MPRKKGKFIDKKKAVSFRLVHRSQRDPLAADSDAPQHVLQPMDGIYSNALLLEFNKIMNICSNQRIG